MSDVPAVTTAGLTRLVKARGRNGAAFTVEEITQALGRDDIASLAEQTGLAPQEVAQQVADRMTAAVASAPRSRNATAEPEPVQVPADDPVPPLREGLVVGDLIDDILRDLIQGVLDSLEDPQTSEMTH